MTTTTTTTTAEHDMNPDLTAIDHPAQRLPTCVRVRAMSWRHADLAGGSAS